MSYRQLWIKIYTQRRSHTMSPIKLNMIYLIWKRVRFCDNCNGKHSQSALFRRYKSDLDVIYLVFHFIHSHCRCPMPMFSLTISREKYWFGSKCVVTHSKGATSIRLNTFYLCYIKCNLVICVCSFLSRSSSIQFYSVLR